MRIVESKKRFSFGKIMVPIIIVAIVLLTFFFLNQKFQNRSHGTKENTQEQAKLKADFKGSKFIIDIKQEEFKSLAKKREEALERGLLFTSRADLVDADIKVDGKSYSCKLRLKGDLLDHLQDDRWSFRIMLKGNKEWRGMNVFSIHNSKARSHVAEWIMHQLFRQEKIIAPDYDFIRVQLNGKDLGVYAYEHHFENQQLENNGRLLGPILKHNDDAYWENVQDNLKPFPWVDASHIELFNKENSKDPNFLKAYEIGYRNLSRFLNEEARVKEVFDQEMMAQYYALLDLSHSWHAQQFTNIRFYLNPLTGKLEPIAFDCFGDHLPKVNSDWEAFGQAYNSRVDKDYIYQRGNAYRYLFFKDVSFYVRYMHYLEQYTKPEFLNNFNKKYKQELDARITFIKADKLYKDYQFSWDGLYKKAQFNLKKLQPKPNMSLLAYRVGGSKQRIELKSFHYFPVEILGFGTETSLTDELPEPILIEAYNKLIPVRKYELSHNREIEFIYFRTLGLKQIHKTALLKTSANITINNSGSKKTPLSSLPYVSEKGNKLSIGSGVHKVNRPIVIPDGYQLEIAAGAELHFVEDGNIVCYGHMLALGSKAQPIKFYSEGQEGSGLFFSKGKLQSQFEYCQFVGLGNYMAGGVMTKAALALYETEVRLENCNFMNIAAEEALGSFYSKAEIKKCLFKNIPGTAITSDYSTMILEEVKLREIGGNGIAMESGSMNGVDVNIKGVINKALDFSKGASAYLWSLGITEAYRGIVAKDHAQVKIMNLWLEKIQQGVEVRGNDEPVTEVDINKMNQKEVENLYLQKKGVKLIIAGKQQHAE